MNENKSRVVAAKDGAFKVLCIMTTSSKLRRAVSFLQGR